MAKLTDVTVSKGANYIYVNSVGTPTENAAKLQAAYDAAKLMTPNGAVKSATNRVVIVLAPGVYTFIGLLLVETAWIDIVSLTANADVKLPLGLSVTSNGNFIKGIDCMTSNFTIATNLNYLVVEKCIALGQGSFGSNTLSGVVISGSFTDCTGGSMSFAKNGTASGTFIRCTSSTRGFATGGNCSGLFIDCEDKEQKNFGYYGTASGTFYRCRAAGDGFAGNGIASGNFHECSAAGYNSFGNGDLLNSEASGNFYNCTGPYRAFGRKCSGKFYNCIGGAESFGNYGGEIAVSARLINCVLTVGTFKVPSIQPHVAENPGTEENGYEDYTPEIPYAAGKVVNCIDEAFQIINL